MQIFLGDQLPSNKFVRNQLYSTASICSSSSSISSIIGSVASCITEFFKSKFPNGFFKDTYISSTMAASAIKKDYGTVKKRPYLFIQPQFDLNEGIMQQVPMLINDMSYAYLKDFRRNYHMIFEDDETGIRIFNNYQRTKIDFRIGIRVNSEMQGWNTISYISQNFQNGGYFYLNRISLYNMIPEYIIQNIAKRKGWNLNEPLDKEEMNQYMLKHSFNSIDCVRDPSSGNDRYMGINMVNILLNYPDMSNQNRQMRNNVVQNSQIEFNIVAELWTPAVFILEMDNIERFKNIPLVNPYEYHDDGKYRFSLVINEDYIPYSKFGRNMIMRRNFLPEVNVEYDEIDLKPVLPLNIYKACSLLEQNGIKMSKCFTVDLYINGRIVFPEAYKVEEKDLILKTYYPMKNTTYTVVVYADMEILNKINLLLDTDKPEIKKELEEFLKDLKNRK
jgi:hypothetical protein